jgi:metaxin
MYLTPNFERFTVPCYINSQTSSSVVRAVSARELRRAAETELLKHCPIIDQQTIYNEAKLAFRALNQWSIERIKEVHTSEATLLDAAVLAYVILLWYIDGECWADAELVDILKENEDLFDYSESMTQEYRWWEVPLPERYGELEEELYGPDYSQLREWRWGRASKPKRSKEGLANGQRYLG